MTDDRPALSRRTSGFSWRETVLWMLVATGLLSLASYVPDGDPRDFLWWMLPLVAVLSTIIIRWARR